MLFRSEDGYEWKDLCKAEIGGKIINEIEELSMLEEMGEDYNIMDDWKTPTLEAIQIAREVKEKIESLPEMIKDEAGVSLKWYAGGIYGIHIKIFGIRWNFVILEQE